MYRGKTVPRHIIRRSQSRGMVQSLLFPLFLLLALLFAGTLAWLATRSDPMINSFLPSHVSCRVEERFESATGIKTDITVRNTGDTDAFLRVRLVSYRTNERGQHIGGIAEIPAFSPGAGWVEYGGFYYYTKAVAPNETAENLLVESIALCGAYEDVDGGRQAIDVLAEAIQSGPESAVGQAWGISISEGSVSAYEKKEGRGK